MIRFGLAAFLVLFIGLSTLFRVSPEAGVDAVILIAVLLVVGLVARLALETVLHGRKRDDDRQAYRSVYGRDDVTTYLSLEDYNRAAEERHRTRMMR